jgi:hypothetical protein
MIKVMIMIKLKRTGDEMMSSGYLLRMLALFLVVAVLLSAFLPGTVSAAVKKVKPDKLTPSRSSLAFIRNPSFVSCQSGYCYYYYPIKLPVGAEIKGLSYQHSMQGGGGLAFTIVGLARVNPKAGVPLQRIYYYESNIDTGSLYNTVKVDGILEPGAVKKVQKGWDYLLTVQVEHSGGTYTAVGTIKVKYNPPSP